MATKTINISLDEKLLKEVDKAAKAEYASRSDYIRTSLLDRLNTKNTKRFAVVDEEYEAFVRQYGQTLKNLANR